MSDIHNYKISIQHIANIIAVKDASSPLYLKGPELVKFFNNLGFTDAYTFVEGRGILTPDFGEGLSRLNYTMRRLEILNKQMRLPEVLTNLYAWFEHQQDSLTALNVALGEYKPNEYPSLDQVQEAKSPLNDFHEEPECKREHGELIVEGKDLKLKELYDTVLGVVPKGHKVVFISYSWDSTEHQKWVSKLADDLTAKGLYVLFDGYLPAGSPLDQFMEFGMMRADRIVLIGTDKYIERYHSVDSGVSFEGCLVRSNIVKSIGTNKIIPCLRTGSDFKSVFPMTLVSRKGYDFRDDGNYEKNLDDLCRDIWDRPRYNRPAIGPIPEYV